jgi:hypothetical protein
MDTSDYETYPAHDPRVTNDLRTILWSVHYPPLTFILCRFYLCCRFSAAQLGFGHTYYKYARGARGGNEDGGAYWNESS